ncbi:MAG: ribosomal protection-like ABC-F family protein [Chitinophagaceae bacterium]
MHYVSVENLTKSYGIKPLFDNISFNIEEGDKIALVARNGSGKSTLLKILAGKEVADSGKVWINKGVDVILFEQEPTFTENKSVLDNIFFHDHPIINAIKAYEQISEDGDIDKLTDAIVMMDEMNAWDFDTKVKQILEKLKIHSLHQPVSTLSGGQRKRIALAKTLIDIGFEQKHVLLIMDEPTNHLDVEMVEWLEHYLDKERITLLLVTHDRYFLDTVCDEIWEISPGPAGELAALYVHKGDYANYLEKKAIRLENAASSIDKARNTYRKELEWMRKQPKARTTKSKSRQDNFYEVQKKAKLQVEEQQLELQMKMNRLGGKIVEMKKVYKSFGEKIILKGFDYTFSKGERIGVVGKNGAGKSTFINMIMQLEQPDSGKINIGDTVVFGNYSQAGLIIKEDKRVIEYVKDIAEHFPLADGSTMSAAQFLQLFLFDPDKQYTYISKLSGGEKRRLHLLSVLFRNPNFLVLDEPTNDLDLPTLSILESFLSEFPGCLLIVSHDRYFMDRLVDHLFVFEGEGNVRDYPGNYSQYRQAVKDQVPMTDIRSLLTEKPEELAAVATAVPGTNGSAVLEKKRLSFKEKREFEQLEKEIADLNQEKLLVNEQLNKGGTDFGELEKLSTRIGEINNQLDKKELRWLELSDLDAN